jgi:5-carboxymethyl-2-hydroxymuconate isomerase
MGTKSIYMPVMPAHVKRLTKTMVELLRGANVQVSNTDYVDLTLTYEECDMNSNRDQNNLCPPIRYYFTA